MNNRYDLDGTMGSKDLETPAALKASDEPESGVKVDDELNDRRSGDEISPVKVRDDADMSNEGGQKDRKGQVIDMTETQKKKKLAGPTVPVHIMEEDPYAEREKRRAEAEAAKVRTDDDVGLETI